MKQVKCPDCGESYSIELKSCPNCGCPNDEWQPPHQEEQQENEVRQDVKEEHKEAPKASSSPNVSETDCVNKTDWANYVYECGVLIWHTFSRKYLSFSGRASRREYWSFTLFANSVWIAEQINTGAYLYFLIFLLPWLSVSVRRMHDINKSGWWAIVPIACFFLALKKSDEGNNDYGEPAIDDI